MSILKSIFCGDEGAYQVNGVQVNFVGNAEGASVFGNGCFGRIVDVCLNNSAVRVLTLGYLHVFIHEMGHALAAQLYGFQPVVNVYTQSCRGDTVNGAGHKFSALAGPLAGMAFEVAKLVGAIACAVLFPPIIGLPLGLFLGAGATFWLFGEIMYALVGKGDWEVIRR